MLRGWYSYRIRIVREDLMQPISFSSLRNLKLPEILFVVAACFAMGTVGFFLAVYLQLHSKGSALPPGTYANSQEVPVSDKAHQLQALSQNTPEPQNTTNTAPSESQASQSDPLAAQKLKLLQQLNKQ